jgi:hypothetical protein
MQKRKKIFVIAKQRPYDEERWKQFIMMLAYALHEQRKAREAAETVQDEHDAGGNQ